MKRIFVLALLVLCLWCALCLPVFAEDEPVSDFFEAAGELPREIQERLPEGFLEGDAESLGAAVESAGSFENLLRTLWNYVSLGLSGALSLFASLLGVIVLSAVFKAFRQTVSGDGVKQAVSLLASLVTATMLLHVQYDVLNMAKGFFESLSFLVNAMAPIMATLYAMGGNVRAALVGQGGMMTFVALLESVTAKTVFPVMGFCTALAVSSAVAPQVKLGGVLNLIKKCYVFFLGALMLLLTFTLSVQTALAAAQDSVAMRGAKMLAGNAIPVVGASVGETLKTVAGSVTFLRSTVGLGGVLLVVFLVIPPLVSVLLHRLAFMAAGVAAEVLGCETESKLIGSFVTIYGYLLAAISICAVTFIFLLTLLVRCRVAIGG